MVSKSSSKGVRKSNASKKKKSGDYQKGRELPVQPKAELKAYDTAQAASLFPTAAAGGGTVTYLNNVVNGAELYQRTGRKIYMKSLAFKGVVFPSGTASANNASLRAMIVYDAQPNGALPTLGAILKDANAAAGIGVFAHLNLDNRERFKVLWTKIWQMGPTPSTQAGQVQIQDGSQCLHIDMMLKLQRLEAVYNATNGGTIADCQSGSLLLVTFADNVSTANAWEMLYQTRLRYYD